ncbi:MAG: muconolactone delta-isomerase [Actinobacteria bacterium]|nr:MAG: muconolactone delta-isomerase [Actinomycetota bacterium]
MEFLVNMTTQVPDGTSEAAVQDIRAREAAHSRELAAQGHLLRLWRPPLQPSEWRTFGLFAADDGVQLEKILASMPLRVWRTDEVTPLLPHPNDPGRQTSSPRSTPQDGQSSEFFVNFTLAIPTHTPADTIAIAIAGEAERTAELALQGHLLRLWVLPGEGRALGLWKAHDTAEMQTILESLPLSAWLTMPTTPLSPHPSDPALTNTTR